MSDGPTLKDLTERIVEFRDARDWRQFHNPKDLAIALSLEAAELLEPFLWKRPDQADAVVENPAALADLRREIADVMIYVLLLAERLGIDPDQAVLDKLDENARKYPVEKSRGNSAKYTELG